ncbi:hypothetical protein [uncultured Bilophila sp.]|uniref:hypothetical protein n=1 Tax=uncultured Bilophila sp. TaxID=529385 RepID=UPI00280B61EE|nr:hypothetical protein [uncultured Bilophila sp.]
MNFLVGYNLAQGKNGGRVLFSGKSFSAFRERYFPFFHDADFLEGIEGRLRNKRFRALCFDRHTSRTDLFELWRRMERKTGKEGILETIDSSEELFSCRCCFLQEMGQTLLRFQKQGPYEKVFTLDYF